MNFITTIILILFLSSCGFGTDDSILNNEANDPVLDTLSLSPHEDSDGDLVSNGDELKKGSNPLVADIPELKFQFMNNFTLVGKSKDDLLEVSSQRDIRSNNFKYRVGEITLWDIARKATAKFSRFDGVVEGRYQDIDLTRVSYPQISPKFMSKLNQDIEIENLVSAQLRFINTLRLKRNKGFQKIVNPSFNFHFKNYETGSYELIGSKKVERNIFEGVLEKFEVELLDLPPRIVEENFYQKGELITAEIDDFEIPSLKTTYKRLRRSVLEKSIPVTVITPLETRVYYVSLRERHNTLGAFLKSIYGDDFKIEDNRLVQASGLTSNLPAFEHLKDLKGVTKKGKWFILFNNSINDDVFQYQFKKGDKVVLNYMTGSELADQGLNTGIKIHRAFESGREVIDLDIGEVGQNDELQITLKPNYIRNEHFSVGTFGFNDAAGHSSWVFHDYKVRNDDYSFTASKVKQRLSLVLNGKEYSIEKLIKEEKLSAKFEGKFLNLDISSAANTFDLLEDDTYALYLRIHPNNHEADLGLWLTGIGGWIAGQSGCHSADAICKGWYQTSGIPLNKVCASVQAGLTNECTGLLKDEYRRRRETLQRDLNFDATFLIVNKYN